MLNEEIVTLKLPYPNREDKKVRVYIPAHEEGETLPVVYMTDGQNLFDEETSSYGSWLTHETVKAEREKSGRAAIIVGIHNDGRPVERNNELTPTGIGKVKGLLLRLLAFPAPEGDVFAAFVINVVKPAVEAQFPVRTGRENTAFCGSSSGGLEAFFMALTYPDIFGTVGAFSPAFEIYSQKTLRRWIKSKMQPDMPFLYLYTGNGEPREKSIYRSVRKMAPFIRECYPASRLREVVKQEQPHHESAWGEEFKDFLSLFLATEADISG